MNIKKVFIAVVLCTIICASCAPMSKESYLDDFASFMNEVAEMSEECSQKEWQKIEARFELYSDKYYEKFKDELTIGDKLVVGGYQAKFKYYQLKHGVNEKLLNNTDN